MEGGGVSKYTRTIKGVEVDVYDVLKAWGVDNPALQHLIKKALQPGTRGHKDLETDLDDIIASAMRAKELYGFRLTEPQAFVKLSSIDKKACSACGSMFDWKLKPGQKAVLEEGKVG